MVKSNDGRHAGGRDGRKAGQGAQAGEPGDGARDGGTWPMAGAELSSWPALVARAEPEMRIVIECLKATIRELTALAGEMQAANERLQAENDRLRRTVGQPLGST